MKKRGQAKSASPFYKNGQVTVFLVVGIVILLLAALIFFITSESTIEELKIEEKEAAPVGTKPALQSFIEDCIKETADPSLYLLAIQGGIIYPDETNQILLTDYGMVNYAWINGVKGLSKEKMEVDLAEYLEEYIDFCLNFESFTKQGILIDVDYEKVKAEFIIQDKVINILLDYPLTIILPNDDKIKMTTFSAQLRSNLGEMLKAVESLEMPDLNPNDLINLPYQSVVFPFDESVTIYSFSEEEYQEAPLSFMFAVRNDFPVNEPPVLDFIPDKTFRVGNVWEEILTADDPNNDLLIYSSDSNLFPVAEDGTIIVKLSSAGTFDLTFTVEDGRGGKDEQEVSIVVLEAR